MSYISRTNLIQFCDYTLYHLIKICTNQILHGPDLVGHDFDLFRILQCQFIMACAHLHEAEYDRYIYITQNTIMGLVERATCGVEP